MSLSKKSATVIILVLLMSGLGIFMYTTLQDSDTGSDMNNDPNSNQSNGPDDNNSEFDGTIGIDGISVEDSGTINVSQVAVSRNHRSQLLNSSLEMRYDNPDETIRIQRFGDRILKEIDRSTGVGNIYTDGVLKYQQTSIQNTTTYSAERGSVDDSEYHRYDLILSLLTDTKITSVEQDDNVYTFKLAGADNLTNLSTLLTQSQDIGDVDAEVRIRENGVVEYVNISVLAETIFGVSQTQTYEYEIEQLGGVEVSEPSWVPVAQNQSSILSVSPSSDQNWFEVQHEGLATIPEGTNVGIITASEQDQVELPESFSNGQTMYIVPSRTGGWDIRIDEIPEERGDDRYSEISEMILGIGQETSYYEDIISV